MSSKKKILVLGGAGYIGATLSPHLQQLGYDITVVDKGWFGFNLHPKIQVINEDVFNLGQDFLSAFDTIIYLAGLSNDPMAEFSPQLNFLYNTGMPAYLGFLAREAGVKRIIFASSCSVYGFTQNKSYTETDATICNYPYGVSKLQGEQSLLALANENFSVICFRQGTVSGFSPRMRLDLAINTMYKNAIVQNKITLSNAQIWRPILGLSDLCEAYRLAIETDLIGGRVFNIHSFNTTIGELASKVKSYLDSAFKTNIKVEDLGINDYRNYKVSHELATSNLNFVPKQNEYDIIADLHFNRQLFWPMTEEKYYNIDVFKRIIKNKDAYEYAL